MARKLAFTLIELLVVIAIIGILAAILFPVYARVKDSAYRSSDVSNLNTLRTSLQLYKIDQGAYPPQLLGYATLYTTGPNIGNVIPASNLVGALYPKRVESLETFRPAYLRGTDALPATLTTAVWPTVGTAYYGGASNAGCLPANAPSSNDPCLLQTYTITDGTVSTNDLGVGGTAAQYYAVSGYDTASVKTPSGTIRELRYTLFWSGYGLNGGSANDNVNQLGYSEPPETAVVTWDSYFRDYDATNLPTRGGKRDIVLFLGGAARPYDSLDVYTKAWQVGP